MDDDDPETRIADLERGSARPTPSVGDGNPPISPGPWDLMSEAGAGTVTIVVHMLVLLALVGAAIAGVGLVITSFVVHIDELFVIGTVLVLASIALMFVASWVRKLRMGKVRWLEGTITLRTVEPGAVGEDGQSVVCEVTVKPLSRNIRMRTTVGPLDTPHLVVGTTMRCRVDRAAATLSLRAYPYARHDSVLPSGRELDFDSVGPSVEPVRTPQDAGPAARVIGTMAIFVVPLVVAIAIGVAIAVPYWPKGPTALHTTDGLNELMALTRDQFGDTTGYRLSVYSDRASLRRQNPRDDRVQDDYLYRRTEWKIWGEPRSVSSDETLADLSAFDVGAVTARLADAGTLLDIDEDREKTYLIVDGVGNGSVALSIHVSGNGLTGYMDIGPDGSVKQLHPPS